MGKQGPCCHCGVTSTPLWRNGPPEKPVLCNACGSRWRTKGSLANYTPLHARLDPDDYEEHRATRVKTISLKRRDEKLNKRKLNYENTLDGEYTPDFSQGFRKNPDEDTSNRSSSGSAISNSESCAQIGSADASDFTDPAHSMAWDSLPSRKRTCIIRPKQSSVEKLTKDLHMILHEQASHFSGSSEEDLLFESETPMGSVEFGHGSVLIRHPHSMARDEESEASSLSFDNRLYKTDDGYYKTPVSLVSLNDSKSVHNSCFGVAKNTKLNLEQVNREKLQILWNHNSPLHEIDLNEVVNYNVFSSFLTLDEQQELLKYLPSVDTFSPPNSIKSMFGSTQFTQNLSSFRDLVRSSLLPGDKTEDCKILKGHYYNMMQDKKRKESTGAVITKQSRDDQTCPEVKTTARIPRRAAVKDGYKNKNCCKEALKSEEGSYLIPTSPLVLHNNGSSFMLDSNYDDEDLEQDQDLLLDIPPNGSFPEAELLHPVSSFGSQNATASSSSIYQWKLPRA